MEHFILNNASHLIQLIERIHKEISNDSYFFYTEKRISELIMTFLYQIYILLLNVHLKETNDPLNCSVKVYYLTDVQFNKKFKDVSTYVNTGKREVLIRRKK